MEKDKQPAWVSISNEILKTLIEPEIYNGHIVTIHEYISTKKTNFNRHHTTSSSTEFEVNRIGWRISGGYFMFEGDRLFYEISCYKLFSFSQVEPNKFEIIECYSKDIYRKSVFTFTKND
jgi:hypothetical protein